METQKNAVYNAIKSLKSFDDGDRVTLTKEERASVIEIVSAGFEADEVALKDQAKEKYLGNPAALKKYTDSLVRNWQNKDTRINGGTKHTIKNPGSRAGSSDAVIKNLKLLKTTLTDESKISEVDAAIQARQAELQAEKAKSVEIDLDVIPAELRESLGL